MGLEAATYIDDLVITNPVAGDNVSQGDDHLRLIKNVVKATLPGLNRPMYLEQASVDLASATTPDLSTPASNYINITGTTQIDGFATEPAGFMRWLRFDGILTLNYNGTSHILPGGDDIVTAAGDHALVESLGSGNWRYVLYHRASGQALIASPIADATESVEGVSELASASEIRSANGGSQGNKVISAFGIEDAASPVALVDAAPVAVDWDAGLNFTLTVTASRQIGNPSNGQVGTFRTILVQGNDGTDRAITFGANFLGEVPTITDCDSARWYLLTIYCVSTSHFVVSSKRAKG